MIYLALLFFSQVVLAKSLLAETLLDGKTLQQTSIENVVQQTHAGGVVIVGEFHGFQPHHDHQILTLQKLAEQHPHVSVGMEFFDRVRQNIVDQYLTGLLPETEFLDQVHWMGPEFKKYKTQVLFPTQHGGTTVGLNASRILTTKVAKNGIDSLSDEDKKQLPPDFHLGNEGYFERFKLEMGGHLPPQSHVEYYFQAQSIWDDTMAWTAQEYLQNHPEQILMIIVGDFHTAHGGGLPDRLRARGIKEVTVISQVDFSDLTPEQQKELINPASTWGPRGDYIWVSP